MKQLYKVGEQQKEKSNYRGCGSKTKYATQETANRSARERERIGSGALMSYFCRECKRWHIGHL